MLDPFEMKANPTCVDCMAWSEDGVLAIGAGESVHIFTPKHAGLSSEREPQTRSTIEWASAKVQVNQFSYEEWPVLRSQQLSFFSLGEELSDSHVISLAWSYEGVGLFRRPVLAVLTSNLLLSLWASQDGSTDWQRILIVNHALRDYFSVLPVDDTGILHRRQRVRSFAWSPPCKNGQCAQDRWGAFFLGIYNDEHEVVVLRLYPFERTTNGTSPVAATVLNHFPLQQPSENETSALGSIFERLSNAKAFASHMAWSTWNWSARDGFYTSHLALTNGARPLMLQLRASSMSSVTAPEPAVGREASAVIAKDENTVMGLEQLSLSWVEEAYEFLRGPICWDMAGTTAFYPVQTSIRNHGLLAIPVDTRQGRLTVGQGANEGIAVPCPSVDQIIAITPIKDSNSAHMAAHLSGLSVQELASSGDACDTLSDKNRLSCSHNKELQKQIEAVRNRFDLDYDLGGHSMVRIWGLASHRILSDSTTKARPRDILAACFTLHPAEMIEHTIPSKGILRIVFSDMDDIMPSNEVDGTLPSLSSGPLNDESIRQTRQHIINNNLLDGVSVDGNGASTLSTDPLLRKIIYAHTCFMIVESVDVEGVLTRLRWLHEWTGLDFSGESSLCQSAQANKVVPAREVDNLAAALTFEQCDICGSGIPWASATESRCTKGHVFVRCGITFLSIQDPTMTKRCSTCSMEFLDETKMMSLVAGHIANYRGEAAGALQGTQFEDHSSFVDRLMAEIYDTCPYCRGKYCI